MSLPTVNGVAKLLEDPALSFTGGGMAVCKLRLVFNNRRKDEASGEWRDADSCFLDAVLFKDAAEKAAESYTRQSEVVVSGRLKTRSYEDKQGQRKYVTELMLDAIGASTRWDTVTINRMARASNGGAQRGGSDADPWSTAATTPSAPLAEEAPF